MAAISRAVTPFFLALATWCSNEPSAIPLATSVVTVRMERIFRVSSSLLHTSPNSTSSFKAAN